jgi:hypothetical protein
MDWWSILIACGIMIVVDLGCHFLISTKEVRQLRAETNRLEKEYQAFLKEVNEAVKVGKQ